MSTDLVSFLRARLDEDELWAVEASRDHNGFVASGAHWQWQCSGHDSVAIPTPGNSQDLEADECDCFSFSLRSAEEFPASSVPGWKLPLFAISTIDEIPAAVAGHILRHDPAQTVLDVKAKRSIIEEYEGVVEEEAEAGYDLDCKGQAMVSSLRGILKALASVYRDHPDYSRELR